MLSSVTLDGEITMIVIMNWDSQLLELKSISQRSQAIFSLSLTLSLSFLLSQKSVQHRVLYDLLDNQTILLFFWKYFMP